jgi:2-amino-4-hydroxy-6-hydroxymethyldihydropteridine diphosphokinase
VTAALVALGSNLEPRAEHIERALRELKVLPGTRLVASSALHETAPVDCPPGSGPFLNAVALLETDLPPRALLGALQALESIHGRTRGAPNAPRTLDLDLLLHGETVLREPDLVLPHPRMHERRFVLAPAAEVAPALRHPLLRRTLRELLEALPVQPGTACAS